MRMCVCISVLLRLVAFSGSSGYAQEGDAPKMVVDNSGPLQLEFIVEDYAHGKDATQVPRKPTDVRDMEKLADENRLWEPWVDTAVVGDMVVRNYSGFGYRERHEVTAVDAKNVTVTVTRTYSRNIQPARKGEVQRLVFSRAKSPALEQFYKSFKTGEIQGVVIKGKKLPCRVTGAHFITEYSINNGIVTIRKASRCRLWVIDTIPLGGVAKKLRKLQSSQVAPAHKPAPATGALYPEVGQYLGWRGDGTGRYPDADPPVKWGRISETLKGLRVQAAKPKGDGPGDAKPILWGAVQDWLVLAPVPVEGRLRKLVDKEECVPGETQFQPDSGDKFGNLQWKPIRVGGSAMYLNRILPDAENLEGKAVYLHTYIYSPREASVFLRAKGLVFVLRVNGERPTRSFGNYGRRGGIRNWHIQLKQGWNRVLARAHASEKRNSFSETPKGSSFFQLKMYGADADEKYEETNMRWTAEPPQVGRFSCFHPVIVGDRIYVTSSPAFLVCYDKFTGKRLWTRYNGLEMFLTAEERAKSPDLFAEIDPKARRFKELGESYDGKLEEGVELWNLHNELGKLLKKVDPIKYHYAGTQEPGLASQPVSDGKFIYTWSFLGVAACYDLDGNRKWMTLENEGPQVKHGYTLAPILVGKDLVVEMQNIIGFDRETGRINWKVPGSGIIYHYDGRPRKGNQTDLVNYSGLGVYKPGLGFFPWSHTTREGNVLWRITHDGSMGFCSTLPEPLREAPELRQVRVSTWFLPGEKVKLPGSYHGASLVQANPLFHDGLVYTVTTSGVLRVQQMDGFRIYAKLLDLNPMTSFNPWPVGAGICASPTLAGKYIYLFSNTGQALVIKPGRKYDEVARNRIERLLPWKLGMNGMSRPATDRFLDRYPEATVSCPVFDGNRIYYRAERYLYCIGKPD